MVPLSSVNTFLNVFDSISAFVSTLMYGRDINTNLGKLENEVRITRDRVGSLETRFAVLESKVNMILPLLASQSKDEDDDDEEMECDDTTDLP